MKIYSKKEVYKALPMKKCIDLMRKTLSNLSLGKYVQPMRTICRFSKNNAFGFMPAFLGDGDYFGAKVLTAFPENSGTEYPSHIGYILLFESIHGTMVGMIDAASVTELRTAAVSGVATDLLARPEADGLALIGAGAQAYTHLNAICCVRSIKRLWIFDLDQKQAEKFAEHAQNEYSIESLVCTSVSDAVRSADIICTLTPSSAPYLSLKDVQPGTHINAVGAFTPTTREVSSDLVANAKLYADQKEAMMQECGEYLIPLEEQVIDEKHIVGEIGELILGKISGRTAKEEITLFDALGLAVEDIACGKSVYESFRP